MLPTHDVMQLIPGDYVGEYRIVEVIGDGGFSIVYKAEDVNLQRTVAVKQLRPEAFSEAGSRDWFIREARLTASLKHPNIVDIYTLREQDGSLFLVMEYLPSDLYTRIKQTGPLDRTTLVKVTSDICRALATLHAREIIHRDIKPENILIAQENQFKLADFGLAHVHPAHPHDENDATGPQPGTLLYMSPEQALGLEVTPQSDIYSLAVVLYEAVTGHYYLDLDGAAEDEDALLELITGAEPLPIDQHHKTVPLDIAEPLMRALSKEPAARPLTARAFLAEIKSVLSRSKHSTLSQKRRALNGKTPAVSPELLRELYAVRTLRDAEHQPMQALELLRTIWETRPGVPEVAAEWGETLVALSRIEEGRHWLETAVHAKPELPFAELALADIYRNVDENDDAADDAIVQAIHADPDLAYAVLYEDFAISPQEPEEYERLVSLFRRAAEEVPTPAVLHNLGQALALSKEHQAESMATFEAAIRLNPDYGPAYVGLGSLLIELGQIDQALPVLEEATYSFFPDVPAEDWHKSGTVYRRAHAFLALAVTYAQIEQYETSAIAARTVLDIDSSELEEDAPQLLDAYVQAAKDWIKRGETLRAYRFLNRIVPLATHWGNVQVFSLLEAIQGDIDPHDRRNRQWDDALDWLKASAVSFSRPSPHDQNARQIAR
jgi:tetratricopeptide (TPR) repeat protein/tRNA A-37 threonylcarbamoyl transferase component Bud32